MTKPRRPSPDDVMHVITVKAGFAHEACPRCPNEAAHRPFGVKRRLPAEIETRE